MVPSSTKENHYPLRAMLPRMREWIGEKNYNNIRVYDYVIQNKKFEHSVEITRDEFEDDQIGIYGDWMEDMGYQASRYPDDLLVSLLTNGNSTLCYDGQYFFDTDHPVNPDSSSSGTQANLFTGTSLTTDTYASVRAAMMRFKGEDGRALNINPNLLVVPPSLETTAKRIVNTDLIAQVFGSNTAAAATDNKTVLKGTADVLVIPDLPDTGTASTCEWYLIDNSRPLKPFIFQQRVAPELTALDKPTDANVFELDKFRYSTRARGNAGYALWFLAAKCTQ